jgi:hypothetical protein
MARKKPPEQVSGRYTAVPHAVLDSVAYMGASYPAKALLLELMRQHTGANNGHLQLATSWLKTRGWTSIGVIQRAKQELGARNLVIRTRLGGLNAGPDLWALTWLPVSDYLGLDLRHGHYQPGAWNRFTADPKKQKSHSVKQNSAIPLAGTATVLTIPFNGTKTALLTAPAIPANGNNVNNHVPRLRSTTKRIVGQPGKSGTGKAPILTA